MSATYVELALCAPLCGVERGQQPGRRLIHAVTMEAIVRVMPSDLPAAELRSACGEEVGLLSVPLGSEEAVPWPISTRGLPKSFQRCHACWNDTGRKRPVARFAPKPQASSTTGADDGD
jgi:hypothetical protein